MGLSLTIDVGDVVTVGATKIRYSKKSGRKIIITIDADKSLRIILIKKKLESENTKN